MLTTTESMTYKHNSLRDADCSAIGYRLLPSALTVNCTFPRGIVMLANFGGTNLASHLSDGNVKDIKMMLIYSGLSITNIARYKNISQQQVTRIKLGDCYSSVDID